MLEGWTPHCHARIDPAESLRLLASHATHEQSHSEFNDDRIWSVLPSGKFVQTTWCAIGAVAMNLLRMIGQNTLNEADAPVRHVAKRRRIKR